MRLHCVIPQFFKEFLNFHASDFICKKNRSLSLLYAKKNNKKLVIIINKMH